MGSLATHPWSLEDGVARGPGIFDMKAGLVQIFHALASLPSLEGVCVLITGDEEVGSGTSRALIEETARQCAATFVLEASADGGAVKTARKGTSSYELVVHGKAAHSGLEPEKGVNAAIEAAHLVLALEGLAATADADAPEGWRTTADADDDVGRFDDQHGARRGDGLRRRARPYAPPRRSGWMPRSGRWR